jgi:peptidoglycan hydrolase-like protein with peptidoglycan-binding domain
VCDNYDLCEKCEAKNEHPADHPLVKFKVPHQRCGGRGFARHGPGFGHPFRGLMHGMFRELRGHQQRGWGGCGQRRWLARGSAGDNVKQVQQALNIPADGFYGPQTEQAVKDFQTKHGLQVDGVCGPLTRAKLFPEEPEKKESESVSQNRTLSRGAVGDAVKELQQALGITPVDGFFGPRTEHAVRAYQAAQQLPVDGIVGPRTWGKLGSKPTPQVPPAPPSAPSPAIDPAMAALMGMGFTNVEVNLRLLKKYNGDLEQVVAEIFGSN